MIDRIVDLYADRTDGPAGAREVVDLAISSLAEASGAAFLEVGVRAGGMSAMLCAVAAAMAPPGFMVLSVDPYGNCPYWEGGRDVSAALDYGDEHYSAARRLLAEFSNSMLFRLDADTFISGVLPRLRWWSQHREYPTVREYLTFAFLDGSHDEHNVVNEIRGVWPYLAPGGAICVDNVDKCPGAVRWVRERLSPGGLMLLPSRRLVVRRGGS